MSYFPSHKNGLKNRGLDLDQALASLLLSSTITPMPSSHREFKFLTLEQAAKILQVSKQTLHRLIQRKQMPGLKVGNQWRIPERQLLKWAEGNANSTYSKSNID